MTARRHSALGTTALAVCVSLVYVASTPVSAWTLRRSLGRTTSTSPAPAPSAALPPLLAFSEAAASGVRPLRTSSLSSSTWAVPAAVATDGPFTTAGTALHGKVARTRPDRARQVVLFQEDDPAGRDALHAVFWDGTRWDDGTGEPWGDAKALGRIGTDGLVNYRNFDAAYEQRSGELLVVAGVNTDESVKYWLHVGSAWNATTLLQSVANNVEDPVNVFDWVHLAPMPGSNRIAFLGVANDPVNRDSAAVEAMIWDGDTNKWGSRWVLSFPSGQAYQSTDAVAVAFTLGGSNAGEALAVWGNGQKVYSSAWREGNWSTPRVAADMGSGRTVRWLRLAADPGSDDMVLAIGDVDGTTGRITTVAYDGGARAWGAVSPPHTVGSFGDPLRNRPFDLAWDPQVGAGAVLLVFADSEGLWSARSLDGGAGFGDPSRIPGAAPAYWVQLERQPDGIVQLAVQDAADDLRGWSWNGATWASTTPAPVSSGLETGPSHAVEPFALSSLLAGRPSPPATDLDGDGRADLLWQNQQSGALSVWFLQNSAVWRTSALRPESFADLQWRVRALGDFDRDGSTDVLWQHLGTRELYAWLLQQAVPVGGAYLSPSTAPDAGWEVMGAADFDGDGGPDILWNDPDTRELHVWLMDGLRVRQSVKLGLTSFADPSWEIRGLADLDADGSPDVLWHNQSTGGLYVWFMKGLSLGSEGYLSPWSSGFNRWRLAQVSDFDGDRKPDLLWHHPKTGELYVWYMDGVTARSAGYLDPSRFGNTKWAIVPR